jgi:2-hydroxychromene-2-carboxylate isomerase
MAGPVRFYFDFISPYAYLAWTQIHELAGRFEARVEPSPVLLAGLLNHHGQKGPAEIPAKRLYLFKDTLRRARSLDVPFSPPPTHPFNPLLALRAACAAPDEAKRALIDALFAATWGDAREKGVDRREVVADAARAAGLDADALLARAATPEIKDALRTATDEAIAAGVFGVPTMRVGDELFWGTDTLEFLALHLDGRDPLPDEVFDRFASVLASAKR